jgi:colanic acid/amylovoran biosynthesis glycosyltransferase
VLPPGAPIARSHAAVTGPPAWAPPPVDGPSVTAEPLRVVCTARLSPEKGVDVLVEAVGRLTAKGVPVTLDLAAQGPDRTALEDLAGRLGISSAVTFRGGYDPRQLATILGAGHVLALTSHTEGAPLSVVEALAHGVPVVATSVGGTAQLVHDGENGVLVPPGDVDAVADALGELARDPARRRRLAVGARNSYLAGPHTPGRVVDEALALYGRARLAALASSPDEMRPSTSRRTASRPRPQA